ncbi:hypothetical protein J7J62_02285 [bacterium]|nr:hypothetical protein [bacterium]
MNKNENLRQRLYAKLPDLMDAKIKLKLLFWKLKERKDYAQALKVQMQLEVLEKTINLITRL